MIIDQLSPTISDNLTDEVPVEQGQLTFKTTWQKVLNLFLPLLHLDDFLRKDGTTVVRWNSSSYDLNNLVTGIVYASTKVQNTPDVAYGYTGEYLVIGAGSNEARVQIALPWSVSISANIKPSIRYKLATAETWTVWVDLPFLLKQGGTMTGGLTVNSYLTVGNGDLTVERLYDTPRFIAKNPNMDASGIDLPSETQYAGVYFRDENNSNVGYVEAAQNTAGLVRTDVMARAVVNGSTVGNRLRLSVAANGTKSVDLGTAVDAWLAALGLGSTSTTTTKSDIISEASDASITSPQYAQWGKVAMLKFSVTRDAVTSTTAVTVGTLKSGKRPAIDTNIISSTGRVFGTISANGQVSIRTAQGASDLSANTLVTIRATYLLA